LCKAATELKGSLSLKVPSSSHIKENATLQNNIKQALAGFVQVPIEYIEIDISETRRLSMHLRRLDDEAVTVGFTVAVPDDASAGNPADVQSHANSLTAADLQGSVTAFDDSITVESVTPVAEANPEQQPAAPQPPAAPVAPVATGTTTPGITITSTPGALTVGLFHKDKEVASQSNAWVYPVFGLVAFLSIAGSVTIYVRSGRNVRMSVTGSHPSTREISRAEDDDQGLLAATEAE
jgi:hypothetical protein